METHEQLLKWAESKGVRLNGIAPKRIPGRGIGIVTTRRLKEDELIMEVPIRALRTLDTVPKAIAKKLPADMSVHGLLAVDLALDRSTKYAKWNAVVPTMADLVTMPFLWPSALQALLPPPAARLLRDQQAKFARDWAAASAAFPSSSEEEAAKAQTQQQQQLTRTRYTHAWLLVNTRTFYHVTPRTAHLGHDDRMVLQPVADLFNHADAGCRVAFDSTAFSVAADRAYAPGEEVHITYGRHSNDFLLAEYGFVPGGDGENRWDEVGLDDAILPALSARQRDLLAARGFLGGYVLDGRTVCYRTEVAVRLMYMPRREWRAFVDGKDDGASSEGSVDELLGRLLVDYRDSVQERISEIDGLDNVAEEAQRSILKTRWLQILELLDITIQRYQS